MKILFLSLGGTYPLRVGGPSIVAYNLIREFDRLGLEVDFVYGVSKAQIDQIQNDSVFQEFSRNINLIPVIKNQRHPKSYNVSFDAKTLSLIKSLTNMTKNKFDIVYFHSVPNSLDIFVPFFSRLRNIPTVSKASGWPNYETFTEKKSDPRLLVYYDYFSLRLQHFFYNKMICNSSFLKHKLVADGFTRAEKIQVIPNGLNVARFRNAERIELKGNPAILYVGRLENIKGIDILVEIMPKLIKELPGAVLHIVGDGSMSNQLRSTVVSHGLIEQVMFHGIVTQKLPSFYKSADICVFPSRFESFGNMILEAMGAGKPIIASNRGGIPEIINDSENGLLIEPSKNELLRSIVALWTDKGLMNKMCMNNLKKAQNFDWKNIAKEYLKLYESII